MMDRTEPQDPRQMPEGTQANTSSSLPEPERPGTLGKDPSGGRGPDGLLPEDFRIEAPSVSLPKGGGAISGMGEKFSANPVTGTASMSLPLPISGGRGLAPSVGLSYDSGAGNGPFGQGWRLGVPSIRRKTDKGLPRYFDDGELADTYVLSDAEDLVPMLKEDGGSWVPMDTRQGDYTDTDTGGTDTTWTISRYRPRVEGGFALIERWKGNTTGKIWWRTITRNNVHRVYGRTEQARVADPNNSKRVFEWLLEEESDCIGNVVSYQYKAEDRDNVDDGHIAERGRDGNVVYRYLKRVSYGNTVMGYNPDAGLSSGFFEPGTTNPDTSDVVLGQAHPGSAPGTFLFHLVFDYGEHSATDPALTPSGTWPARQDAFSSFRSGFDVRCHRLCQRVYMMHVFTELRESAGSAVPVVVKSLELAYTERETATTLDEAWVKGWAWDTTASSYTTETLPKTTFSYTQPTTDETVRFVDGIEDLPSGLDTRQWRWIDLDGEGLSGLLTQQSGGLYYKRNEGQGQLAPARKLARQPAFSIGSPGVRLVDLDGDGNLDVVVMRPGISGYMARSDEKADSWEDFRSFRGTPSHTPDNPDVRLIDLDGDGHADILVTEEEVFTWYPSEARDGFGAPLRRPQSHDEDNGPRLLFSKHGEQIFLADMSGDGLTDIVRVRNGRVDYWPNLGYGRFGKRITMKGAPCFDKCDQFDPARIRLADIDGSGPTDLLYVGRDGVQLYFNHAGNGFSAVQTLTRFPSTARPNDIQIADIRGDGTACLVWSSPLLKETMSPLRYVRLMADGKPWLMTSTNNGLGRTTTLSYTPSTDFYTADRQAGTPWATRLPFPVQCLSRVETYDAITGLRFASRYAYHHGYFDGPEREFRGFGMVEQWDVEVFSDYTGPSDTQPSSYADLTTEVPPVRTRTWFHTGAWKKHGTLTAAFAGEYFDGDNDALHLPEPTVPVGLSVEEEREAVRALRGQMLRQEVYAEDDSGNLAQLYTVTERTFALQQVQPKADNRFGSFLMVEGQTLSLTYDLDVSSTSTETPDPRVSQSMTLEVDEYGTVLRSAVVSYRRRTPTGGSDGDLDDEQKITRVIVSESDVAHQDSSVSSDNIWRIGVPYQSRVWEFSGTVIDSTSSKGLKDTTALADPATLNTTFTGLSAANTLLFEEAVPSDGYRRLLGHQQTTFYNDALSAEAAVGTVGKRALPYQKYALAYTQDLVDDLYNETGTTRVDSTVLEGAGYVDLEIDPRDSTTTTDAHWWIPSGRTELDASAFYHPTKHLDPFRTTATNDNTALTWDSYDLMITEVESPEINSARMKVVAVPDYRVMAPSKVTDPNGTESTATFDALGRVTKTAIRNTVNGNAFGDGTTEHSGEFSYDTTNLPVSAHSKVRKEYGGTATWQESYAYSDGGGNVIQIKVQAEGGDAPRWDESTQQVVTETVTDRWVGSGRVIVDNKGNVVKQYEPFFSQTSDFEDEDEVAEWGVSAVLTYDAIGRNTRIDLPDDNFRTWSYDPWKVVESDENDNIDDADTTNPGYDHRGTPTTTHLDAQGRVYKSVVLPDRTGTEYVTTLELDTLGNPLTVTDPRGNDIQIQQFDVLGRPAFTGAADEGYDPSVAKDSNTKGKNWMFAQVDGQPEHVWRSGSLKTRQVYDALRRPRELYVDEGAGEHLVTLTVYGDELTDTADESTVEDNFLKGKPAHIYDTAGRVTFAYDFRGLTLSQSRQVITDIDVEADWSDNGTDPTGLEEETTLADIATWLGKLSTSAKLDTETFTTSSTFDARGLMKTSTAPDSSVTTYTYDAGGQLTAVSADIHGTTTKDFVDEITYNARGQRLKITYANDTETTYTYDANRFRLTRLLTTRNTAGTPKLQDLGYSYDPVGNIVEITDAAQQTLYFANAQVSPTRGFTYDALYRLIEAAGREKTTLTQTGPWDPSLGGIPDTAPANTALRRYVQSYFYDEAGNITEMKHVSGGTTQWRRGYDYEVDNNQLKATSNVGPSTSDVFGVPSTYSDTYSYNSRGAMDFMPHLKRGTGITTNIERDFRDHIRKAEFQGGSDYAYYAYDADGIRVRKECFKGTGGNLTEERIYIGGYEVWRKRTSGTLTEERETLHVMDGTRRICRVETETTASPSAVTRYRFQYADHLGTACVETDQSGAIITYEEFYPYGSTAWWAEKSGIQVSRKRYRYTGMEKDEETGLSYHNARYYMAWLGRWERPDPFGLGDGLNRFTYVRGNPVGGMDPSGMATTPQSGFDREALAWTPEAFQIASYSGFFPNQISKDVLRQYASNDDPNLVVELTQSETAEISPVLIGPVQFKKPEFIGLSKGMAGAPNNAPTQSVNQPLPQPRIVGGNQVYQITDLIVETAGYAQAAGTIGRFQGVYNGYLTVRPDGSTTFEGVVNISDEVDYRAFEGNRDFFANMLLTGVEISPLFSGTPYKAVLPTSSVRIDYDPQDGWNITSGSSGYSFVNDSLETHRPDISPLEQISVMGQPWPTGTLFNPPLPVDRFPTTSLGLSAGIGFLGAGLPVLGVSGSKAKGATAGAVGAASTIHIHGALLEIIW